MKVAVLYESRTGNTARVARMIGAVAEELGAEAGVWSSTKANLDFLTGADLVFVGTWTDGVIIAGHRHGDSRRLKAMPGLWVQRMRSARSRQHSLAYSIRGSRNGLRGKSE